MRFSLGLTGLAFVLAACGGDEASDTAPSTDILIEQADGLAPTDAAATTREPINAGTPGGETADDTDLSPIADDTASPATPASPSSPDAPAAPTDASPSAPSAPAPSGGTTGGTSTGSTPSGGTPAPAPAPQPGADQTRAQAAASAMWGQFRTAVSGRNTAAIGRLIADPVLVDGQSTSHADFADRVPDGDIGAFVANFGGSLSPAQALRPASGGGYHGLATATTEDGQQATLLFRVAPSADGTWRVVEITPAD